MGIRTLTSPGCTPGGDTVALRVAALLRRAVLPTRLGPAPEAGATTWVLHGGRMRLDSRIVCALATRVQILAAEAWGAKGGAGQSWKCSQEGPSQGAASGIRERA